jgi:DNA ligase (NAD+)
MNASVQDIQAVERIGPKVAESVHGYFREPQKRAIIEKLRKAGVNFTQQEAAPREGPLAGLTFVFTGTLAAMPRSRAEALVAAHGADAASSVTRKVSYLVAGADPGSKLQKAEGYGVPVLNEDEFWALIREQGVEA